MLNKAKTLKGYKLNCLDGEIGGVKEFYFDDRHWAIRYLVADTGKWLTNRQVLISPYAMKEVVRDEKYIVVNLTKKQIEDSPPLESDKPVSRQFEAAYFSHYGWPIYWSGPYMWGASPDILRMPEKHVVSKIEEKIWDPHLRSTNDVDGHNIQAVDGEIGRVNDFIIDDRTWAIRYLVVDTGDWLPGKKVLISPKWIERVSWDELKVFVNLTRDAVKHSPEYTQDTMPDRSYESSLHLHYKRQGYWGDAPDSETHSG
jgi:uncharacterized protein YrrD